VASLSAYLAATGVGESPARVELETGSVEAWSVGNRRVNFYGVAYDGDAIAYDSALAAVLVAGDTVAALKVSSTYLILCKIATA